MGQGARGDSGTVFVGEGCTWCSQALLDSRGGERGCISGLQGMRDAWALLLGGEGLHEMMR